MSEQTIEQRIKDKRTKLIEIHGSMALYLAMDHPASTRAQVNDLQHRLEFRVKEAEEQLLDAKIDIYGKVLAILKTTK